MTALVQEIVGRVQLLPKERQLWLLETLSDENAFDFNDVIRVETDLTDEEKQWAKDGRREFHERPDTFISLDDYLKEREISVDMARVDRLKVVYA